jgi:hypothetical protein
MSRTWYFQHDDQIQGPYTLEEMKKQASEGMLDPAALILQVGDAPEDARSARDVLGADCFALGPTDSLLTAGLERPAKPSAFAKKKPAKLEHKPKITLRIRKRSKKHNTARPTEPAAEGPPRAVPLATPVADAPLSDVPLAAPIADEQPTVDLLDFLIDDRMPVKKARPIAPAQPQPPCSPRAAPKPIPVARPALPKKPQHAVPKRSPASPAPPAASPASPAPQMPFLDAFRKARFAVDDWLDGEDNRALVRTGDVEEIRRQPGINDIFTRYEDYGPAFDEKLRQHLAFTTENRARYYNARPNG